ncbi:hypothetical protein D9M71_192870 [compost metagenome]
MQGAQFTLQLVGFALVRGQLLTQRCRSLTLGFLVGLVGIDRRSTDRRVALAILDQPAAVVVEVAVEGFNLAIGHQQEVVGGAFEQMAIVGNHQHRTAEFLQCHGQCQAHFQVQVVGRLIEQQQVRAFPGDQRQGQARLFATGEIQHRLVDTGAAEVKATEEVTQRLLALGRCQTLQVQQRAGLVVQRVQLMLSEVAHRQVLTAHQTAAQWLQLAGQVFDQRRFARAVGAEQADTRTRSELQLDLLKDGLVAVTQTTFGQVEQRTGNLFRFTEDEVKRRVHMRRRQFFHALQGLDPALRLAGLGGLGLEAGDVLFHVRALRLLLLVGLLLLRQALGTGALEGGVATLVQVQLALLDVQHMVDHGVEEVAVVGDQ